MRHRRRFNRMVGWNFSTHSVVLHSNVNVTILGSPDFNIFERVGQALIFKIEPLNMSKHARSEVTFASSGKLAHAIGICLFNRVEKSLPQTRYGCRVPPALICKSPQELARSKLEINGAINSRARVNETCGDRFHNMPGDRLSLFISW